MSIDPSKRYSAFLFDMDGTILSSAAAAERVWGAWARRKGIDLADLVSMHGTRVVDMIARLGLPGVDPEVEAALIEKAEIEDTDGVEAIPGAREFLAALPSKQWAIVTSSSRALAEHRLRVAGLPMPPTMISSEDVTQGKPSPQAYILGAERLGVCRSESLVFEDVTAGVQAGTNAGASVIVIEFAGHKVDTRGHQTVHDYTAIRPVVNIDGTLSIKRAVD